LALVENAVRPDACWVSNSTADAWRSPFEPQSHGDVVDLIREYPLAWVCPLRAGSLHATLLPLLAETDGEGRVVSLLGHMARRNPLCASLQSDPAALVLFTGPQAYVSPACVSDPNWGPTWNYAQVRIEAGIRFEPDGGDHALAELVRAMEEREPTGWTPAKLGARYRSMERAIIAFRATVASCESRFKLGQDEKLERLREILERHPDAQLVRWMRRLNRARL
jgi:transcriptional regulator